jgi:two-component system cell cycle sensor histidine kinase/response regulator CckA
LARAPALTFDLVQTARGLAPRSVLLLAAAGVCAGLALTLGGVPQLVAVTVGATFAALVILVRGTVFFAGFGDRMGETGIARMAGLDATPCLTTDDIGQIVWMNVSAEDRFRDRRAPNGLPPTLPALLGDMFANPGAVVFRLQSRAENLGAAREDVVTRRSHLRLSVHRVSQARYLWRLDEFVERGSGSRGAGTLGLPMLVANKTGVVLFANEAVRRLVGSRPKHLDRVFTGPLPPSGEEVVVSGTEGPVRAILAEFEGAGERREIFLLPVAGRPVAEASGEFEHLPVAMMRLAADGTILVANRMARDLFGMFPDNARSLADLVEAPGRPLRVWLDDVAAGRLPFGSETVALRAEGMERFVQVNLHRVAEEGGAGLIAVLHDATALKTMEAQFVQSQKMQAIGQLAGGIAHDFNNLLTAILGHCDLLMHRHDTQDPDYGDLAQIQQNAHRAAGLVKQLLAYSRKQTLKPQRVDLEDALSELTHLLNRLLGEKVSLTLVHGPGLGPVLADPRQLEQVIMNLVVNARDAMPDGGRVTIETAALHLDRDQPRGRVVLPRGDYSVIRVTDTGTGIPADLVDKVFEPFFTTKRVGEGTGLGLSMVYGIVKQSGGYIFVDSPPGLGATIELVFPVHAGADPPQPEPRPDSGPLVLTRRSKEGVVLLVEDEAPVRAFASRALRMRGFTVVEADSAEAALSALSDPRLEVDIFVTDVVMPGMDGPTWVKEALRERPGVKVVFVSGYAEDHFAQEREELPEAVFLSKPFSLNDLTQTVQRVLH